MASKRLRVVQRRECFYVERWNNDGFPWLRRGWEHERLFMSLETAKKYIAERIRVEGSVVYEKNYSAER